MYGGIMKNAILSLVVLATAILIINTQTEATIDLTNAVVCVPCGK
jgi:hypothetical protein